MRAGKVLVGIGLPFTCLGSYILWWSCGRGRFVPTDALTGAIVGGMGYTLVALGLWKLRGWVIGAAIWLAFAGFAAYLLTTAKADADARHDAYQRAEP